MSKILVLISLFSLLILQSCLVYGKKDMVSLDTTVKQKEQLSSTLSSVNISNNQVTINGSGFSKITSVKIKGSNLNADLNVNSKSDSQIIASATSALSLLVGETFDLIIGTADAQATYSITFTLQNDGVQSSHLASMGASSGQILKYNGSAWVPSSLASSQTYLGIWNASTNNPDIGTLGSFQSGDYFIVNTAGTFNSIAYSAGDWAMFNGTAWSKIDNTSNVVASFNGRNGIVTLTPSDYVSLKDAVTHKVTGSSLNDIADIDLTTIAPTDGQLLKWNSTTHKWEPSDDLASGGAGSVGSTEIAAGAISNSHINATADIAQSKIHDLATDLAAKEPTLTAGTTAQYYRGDKGWQTLNTAAITESTNLYFTNARALGVPLALFDNTLTGQILATDTILQAFGRTQNQITSLSTGGSNYLVKNGTDSVTGQVTIHASTGSLKIPTTPSGGDLTDAANVQYVNNYADTKLPLAGGTLTGNVGIGTTNLTATFSVVSSSTSSGAITLTALNAATTFTTSASTILNVGDYFIPTTTTGQARAVTVGGTGTSFTVSPAFTGAVSGETFTIYPAAMNINSGKLFVQGSTGKVGIGTTNPSQLLSVGASSQFTVTSGGNVGVGTTAPVGKLHIQDGAMTIKGTGATLTVKKGTASPNTLSTQSVASFDNETAGGVSVNFFAATSNPGVIYFGGTGSAQQGNLTYQVDSGTPANQYMSFTVNSAERVRINSSGNVGIGTTAPGYKLQVGVAADGSEARANAWNVLSDERLKRDFEIIPDSLDKLLSLNGYYYYWNRGVDHSKKIGLKAQEVEKVFPEVISKGNDGFLSVSYNHFVAVVVEAIKEFYSKWFDDSRGIHREMSSLKMKTNQLEKENKMLKNYLCKKDKNAEFCY